MADENTRMSNYLAEDIVDNIDEVRTARGEYDSLDDRLDDIESGSFTPTQAQLAAINSGITSADVAQITTNKNNILLLTANGGGKNLLNSSSPVRLYNATYSNGIVTQITDDTLSAFRFSLQGYSAPATYVKLLNQVNTTKNGRIRLSFTKDNTFSIITIGHSGAKEDCKIFFDISNLANGDYYAQINLINYQQSQGKYQFNELMIYDTKYDMLYQPYALSNAELTDNVLWNTNNGAKNLLSFDADMMKSINTGGAWSGNTWSLGNNVTLTINSDKSITLNGTANAGKTIYLTKNLGMAENAYTLSTGALTTKLWAGIIEVGGTENNYTGSTTHLDKTCQPNHITLYIESGCTLSNLTIYPMLTLKSLYDADPSYQSYAMSSAKLTAEIADIIDSTYGTAHNVDLDTLTKGGRYLVNGAESSTSNAPFANWQTVEVYESNLDGYTTLTVQIATELGAGLARKFRRRTYSGGGQYSAWTAWTS